MNPNLNPQQFYHVTRHAFQPGDEVTSPASRGTQNRFNEGSPAQNKVTANHNYMTTDLDFASKFKGFARTNGEAETETHTYEVEPTGKYSRDRHTHSTEGAYKTKDPLKVVTEVHVAEGMNGRYVHGRKENMDEESWERRHYPGRWMNKNPGMWPE